MCNCCGLCSEKVRRYAFWSLVALLTALTVHDVIQLFGEYFENPKVADMGYKFNTTMQLPTFTVCIPTPMVLTIFNSSMFNKEDGRKASEVIEKELAGMKSASDFLNRDWDWRLVEDAYRTIAKIHSLERESDDSFVGLQIKKLQKEEAKTKELKRIQKWQKILKDREVAFVDFVQKTGEEVLKRMVKKAQRSSLDNDNYYDATFKVTWISAPNLCFQPQFSGNGSGEITTQGNFFFMKIGHDFRKLDSPPRVLVDLNGRQANMAEFEDGEWPGGHTTEGVNNGITAGMISDLEVEVRTVYELLENQDPGTACVDLDDDDDQTNDGEFTPVFECRGRCRTDLIRELCQCTPISAVHLSEKVDLETFPPCDYSKCQIRNDSKTMNEKRCIEKCRHGCKITRYSIKQLSLDPSILLRNGAPMQAPNQTSFFLTWGSFEFLSLEQSYKYDSFVTFLSELGGALGVWLGLSVLTLLQGSVYVTEKVSERVKVRRKKTAQPGSQEKDETDSSSQFSQNPFGSGNVSENPFADFSDSKPKEGGAKKRSTASATSK